MHIIKGETRNFSGYVVSVTETVQLPKKKFWQKTFPELFYEAPRFETIETVVKGVVEADDHTGLLVVQEFDEFGYAVYTNGLDTISTDDAVKVLLLAPIFRQAFHQAGFRPKLTSTYVKGLKIKYHGPPQTLVKVEQPNKKELVEAGE